MTKRVHLSGPSPWNDKAISTALCGGGLALSLFSSSLVMAQEPDSAPEAGAEVEVEADTAEPGESTAASDDDGPSELSDSSESDPNEAPAEDGAPAGEPEPRASEPAASKTVPADEQGLDWKAEEVPEEEEPDYFGGYEPTSPSLSLDDDYEPPKPGYQGPFRGGAFRLGLSIGGGTYGTETYFIPGFGVGYFLVNGLEVHVDTDFWLIGDPFLATPSPGLRYVMWFVPKVHPYVGAFYRHYFVGSGYEDADSVGARGGVYLMTGRSSYFGLGVAYEHMLQDHLFADTDFIYPELAFVFAF